MPALTFPPKDPDERLDYGLNWSARLTQGDKITSHALTVEEGTLVVSASTHTETQVNFWAEGGTPGEVTQMLCRVTTQLGRIMDQTAVLWVIPR